LTMIVRPTDAVDLTADVRLARQYPDAASWALASYRRAASSLPAVWPCAPDEERVRYYVWASRQIRDAHGKLTGAWDVLTDAFVMLGAVVHDLDEFERTGRLPELTDADLAEEAPTAGVPARRDPVPGTRVLARGAGAVRQAPATSEDARIGRALQLAAQGVSQKDIAREVHASPNYVSRWLHPEKQARRPRRRGR
jgi:hypothetical protein